MAQSQGYYSGIVETSEYGSLQLVNLQRMLSDVVAKCSKEQYFNNFAELCGAGNHLLDFCQEYEEIYIYGAGVAGQRLAKLLLAKKMPVAGFMVSDGYTFPEESPLPCYHLSEVQPQENRGVIVAGTRGNKGAMLAAIRQQGWVHVYCRY